MKYLIFGTGEYCKRYIKWFEPCDIAAFIDNDADKQNSELYGVGILSPQEGVKLSYDRVVILSFYYSEMKAQLTELGVPENKIFHFYDLPIILDHSTYNFENIYYKADESDSCLPDRKKILLLSQDLEMTGPAIALSKAAYVLKKRGYTVDFASMVDGSLRDELNRHGIDVIVSPDLQIKTMSECRWIDPYDVIVCSTLNFHSFLMGRDLNKKVIWWLHDHKYFYEGAKKENFSAINTKNLSIYAAGPIAQAAIKEYYPYKECEILLYGVDDFFEEKSTEPNDKPIVFTVIGYISRIKGQDIIARSIKMLNGSLKNRYNVIFVGNDMTYKADELKRDMASEDNVCFTGVLSRSEIKEIFGKTDVLVCPSRLDVMPTVCAEAMMNHVPCIVSDAVGTADYILEYNAGCVFESENFVELASIMKKIIIDKSNLSEMGGNARKLYEKMFSAEVFEKNLIDIIETV